MSMSTTSRLKATVHIGGLAAQVTSETLHAAFVPFGDIVEVTLPRGDVVPEGVAGSNTTPIVAPAPGSRAPHRGFGYVEFDDAADAREACDNMDHSELFGRVIRVAPAKPPRDAGEGLGSKTALWEQEGWLAKHAVSDEDRRAATGQENALIDAMADDDQRPADPMEGLEGLDEAGPRPAQ